MNEYDLPEQIELVTRLAKTFQTFDDGIAEKRKRENDQIESVLLNFALFKNDNTDTKDQEEEKEVPRRKRRRRRTRLEIRPARLELRTWWEKFRESKAIFDLSLDGFKVTKIVASTRIGVVCQIQFPARACTESRLVVIPWDYNFSTSVDMDSEFLQKFKQIYYLRPSMWSNNLCEHLRSAARKLDYQATPKLQEFFDRIPQ